MHDALMLYFDGEKHAGLYLAAAGAVIIVFAAVLLRPPRSFAVTLVVLAIAEIALGVGLYLRTGPQVSRLVAQLGSEPAHFHSEENVRMERVQRNFIIVEYVELSMIILSAILAVTQKNRPMIAGIALGLLIHTALLLAFDLIAERRGAVYLRSIIATART
jgi:hypothetical protein